METFGFTVPTLSGEERLPRGKTTEPWIVGSCEAET